MDTGPALAPDHNRISDVKFVASRGRGLTPSMNVSYPGASGLFRDVTNSYSGQLVLKVSGC